MSERNAEQSVKITIKPYYRGETLNYTVGIVESLGLYVIHAVDTNGFVMGNPGKTSESNPSFAIFGITEEEFNLKDTDRARLDDLAFTLMRELPVDRIIAENNLRSSGRADTIDDGAYAASKKSELDEKRKRLIEELSGKAKEAVNAIVKSGEGWYLTVKGAPKIIPALDNSGALLLFTKEEYAVQCAEKSSDELDLCICKIDKSNIQELFRNLFRFGITTIKTNPGSDMAGETERDEVVSLGSVKEYGLSNSVSLSLMIRYAQSRQIKDKDSSQKACSILWSAIAKSLPNGPFFIPFAFEGENVGESEVEREIYFSDRAIAYFKEKKPAVLGIELYKPSNGAGRVMRAAAIKRRDNDGEKSFFPIYTDLTEFRAEFGDKARPFAVTFNDISEKISGYDGVMINSKGLAFVITAAGMENIAKTFEKSKEDKGE